MPSTIRRSVRVTLLLVCAPSAASAQLSGPGLQWQGSSGSSAGSFLPGCVTHPVSAIIGETVTLQVWGDFQAPFALFASLHESACMTFPGIDGGLLLGLPVFPLASRWSRNAPLMGTPCHAASREDGGTARSATLTSFAWSFVPPATSNRSLAGRG